MTIRELIYIEWKVNTVKYLELIPTNGHHEFRKFNRESKSYDLINYQQFNDEVVAVQIENSKLYNPNKKVSFKVLGGQK